MGYRFRLANWDHSTAYDLVGGILRIYDWSWSTRTATTLKAQAGRVFAGYPVVAETIPLASRGCDADIRAALHDIERALVAAREYDAMPVPDNSQWLEWTTRGELGRRSLLLGGEWQFNNYAPITPLLDSSQALVTLGLLRHPAWEAVVSTTTTETDISCCAGTWDFANIMGTMDARAYIVQFQGRNGGGGPIDRIWCGWRPEYEGLTAFDPVWECEDGTNEGGVGTTDQGDVTASAANKVEIDLGASPDFAKRFVIEVDDILVGDYEHMSGRYLVLARCKVQEEYPGTAGIQICYGYSGAEANAACPEIFDVDNEAWRIRELGEIQFPPEGRWQGISGNHLRRACIEVWAEDIDGGPKLDMDVLYLIPSEHFLHFENATILYAAGEPADLRPVYVVTLENDTILADQYLTTYPNASLVPEPKMWYLPYGNSTLVVVGERTASHVLTDAIDISVEYVPRYLSYEDD